MKLMRSAAWLGIGLVLVAVFAAYLRPDVAMTLAAQLWSCF
ncbi:MAG: hypothetical protein ABIP61_04680 [Burkholderiaceae bacterium]